MNTYDYIMKKLEEIISVDSPSGFTARAAEKIKSELSSLGFSPVMTNKGGVFCELGGEGEGLLITAHIDTLGGMVKEIKANGRLKITPLGGLIPVNTETECCRIYTRGGKLFEGTFQLENASVHVNGNYSKEERSFDKVEIVIDEDVKNEEETKALGISVGDIVCAEPRFKVTESGYIKSRFLDDKLSAAILLGLAKEISENKFRPAKKIYLHFTVYEEVGHGGTASIPEDTTEILSVDMGCVGEGLSCTEKQVSICVKDSAGPYNYDMTTKLIELAKENKLSFAADVYPYYGSDADAAVGAGHDLRHALIGAGVYASHGYERSHVEGMKNTFELTKAYTEN